MENNIAPEIWEYTRQIVKNTLGTQVKLNGFEWSNGGGLFCKVFKINTNTGDFILKVERDKIFFATRKDQIENEVFGNAIFRKAGIACPDILAYDFTKNDTGVRYVFMEHITNKTEDWPLVGEKFDELDEKIKSKIRQQVKTIIEKEKSITNSHFGSLSPSGTIGRHETYDKYYHSALDLLIQDSEEYNIFTSEELDTVKQAAAKKLVYSKKYIPAFVHGDLGYHNLIWGNINGGENKVYVIDFGNAYFGLPYITEIHGIREEGADIIDIMGLDRDLYENNLISSFEGMFWTVTQQLTEDYEYGRMADWIKSIKNENPNNPNNLNNSRTHITDFVDKCRKIL